MAYTAQQVDSFIDLFEKVARKQNASKASDVRLRAAERDLLQIAEKVRDLLRLAVKDNKMLLKEVFGGDCLRFHRLREAIDTVSLSEMHSNDQRWRHLTHGMVTIEEVLKDLGAYRSAVASRKSTGPQVFSYRGLRARFLPGERVTMRPACESFQKGSFGTEMQLPDGLVLDVNTGEITGILKPGVEVPDNEYLITAKCVRGEAIFKLNFAVALPPPRSLSYPGAATVCYIGEVIIWPAEVLGGLPKEWSVNPVLPLGLSLDRRTGAIAGIPRLAVEPADYAVTAGNNSGQATGKLRFAVKAAPPTNLFYPDAVEEFFIGNVIYLLPEVRFLTTERKTASEKWQSVRRNMVPSAPQNGILRMPLMDFSVEPALPQGLSLAPKTGKLMGTPSKLTDATTYRITCRSGGGEVYSDLCFAVVRCAPSCLRYLNTCSIYWTGEAVTITPVLEGAASEWRVTPELPVGLHLDSSLGIISGIPTKAISETTWTVVAGNPQGHVEATLAFCVCCAAPSSLTYVGAEQELPLQKELTLWPTFHGEVDEFKVVPNLPTGLVLDRTTGIISGKIEEPADVAVYTVTATNEAGSAMTTLTFSCAVLPPTSVSYPRVDDLYNVGESVSLQPEVLGGAASWRVEPELPKGLELDEATGRITGTPAEVCDEINYVITATNELGGTSVDLTFSIDAPPPEGLSYPFACSELHVGEQVLLEPEILKGWCLTFSIEPALSQGLEFDTFNGNICGMPAAPAAATTYTVTASNKEGSTSVKLPFFISKPTANAHKVPRVDQQFAQVIEEVTDLADLVAEPRKDEKMGDWMVWMVHRVWLNDPSLTDLNFTSKFMPAPHSEPRIAPKLMKAMKHNTHLVSLLLPNSNMMKPQGDQLAESLKLNCTLQVLNIESNHLDCASIKHIAEALKENQNTNLEQLRFSNQSGLSGQFGRSVEQAFAELLGTNHSILKLGFACVDPNWRHHIERGLLRNNDLARRRRKGTLSLPQKETEVAADEKSLRQIRLASVPSVLASSIFSSEDENLALVRSFVASKRRLPTKEQLQNFAKSSGKSLPYSAVAPVRKAYCSALLGALLNGQAVAYDAFGVASEGTIRAWAEKNGRWSVDLWQTDGSRFNFTSAQEPIIEVSEEVAAWQQVPE